MRRIVWLKGEADRAWWRAPEHRDARVVILLAGFMAPAAGAWLLTAPEAPWLIRLLGGVMLLMAAGLFIDLYEIYEGFEGRLSAWIWSLPDPHLAAIKE